MKSVSDDSDNTWFYIRHRGVDIMGILIMVMVLMMVLFLVIMAMVIIPAYPTVTAADLVMLVWIMMILVMSFMMMSLKVKEILVRMIQCRSDQLCLLHLIHVNIDGDILGEVAGDQDVHIVDVDPHVVGMCLLDSLKRIA